jgi:6-pyruvoyltetrahydropterin/6-carboxytetrahydropterin synthase
MKLGVTEYIDCAHFLPGHEKCGRLHGHTYKIEIMIEGDHKKGMIIDFADLKKQSKGVLLEYDHRSWNDFLEFPSVENICELISSRLKERLPFPFVLRVWEGHGKWAETTSASV